MSGSAEAGHHESRVVHTRFTSRVQGDLAVDLPPDALQARRAAIAPTPWTWLRQVHGADVVVVTEPGEHAGTAADAAVSAVGGVTLAVHSADCAPVLLHSTGAGSTVIGAAHAGWRGLRAGVLQRTVEQMRQLGADDVAWRLGPCISPAAYEFGSDDLEQLRTTLGDAVVARTATGAPALDLRAGVRAALTAAGASPADPDQAVDCTATDPSYFSWRARHDRGRQAAVVWTTSARTGGSDS
ncbi:MAG: polyphenol oxidase family protein [Microthrixaceae bacterium]